MIVALSAIFAIDLLYNLTSHKMRKKVISNCTKKKKKKRFIIPPFGFLNKKGVMTLHSLIKRDKSSSMKKNKNKRMITTREKICIPFKFPNHSGIYKKYGSSVPTLQYIQFKHPNIELYNTKKYIKKNNIYIQQDIYFSSFPCSCLMQQMFFVSFYCKNRKIVANLFLHHKIK
uniref:Uncharacterized protein n=1 Tax=Strigamia maritima TaxID=126957 RepID=T1JP02_STRMM